MSWSPVTRTVLYRSARSWRTKRNYEIFSCADFNIQQSSFSISSSLPLNPPLVFPSPEKATSYQF